MWPDFNWNNNSTYYNKKKNKFTECLNSKCDQTYSSGRVIYSTDMHISRGNTSLCPRETSGFEANADVPEPEHRPQERARFHRQHSMPAAHTDTRTAKASVELSISQISELSRVKKGINHMREIIKQKKARQYKTEHESTEPKGLHGKISKDRIKLVQSHIIKNFRYSVQKDQYLPPRELIDIDPQSNTRHKHAHQKLCRNVKCSCHCRQLNSSKNYKKTATEFAWHARGPPLRVYTTARSDEVVPPYKAEKRYATEFLKGYLREESSKAMQTNVLQPRNKVFTAVRPGEKSAYMVRDFTGRCNRNMCGARVNKTSSSGSEDDVCCSSSSSEIAASAEPRLSMRDVSCGCRKDEFREYFNAMRKDNKNIDVPLKQPSRAPIGTDQCVAVETISRDKSNINPHPVDPHCDCDICKKLISDFISTLPPHHRELVATSDYKATKQRTDPRSNISKDSGCDCTACGNVPDLINKSGAKNKKAKQKKCFENYPKLKNYLFSPHKVAKKTDPVYQRNIACSPFCSTTVILTKDGTQTKIHHSPKGRKTVICSSSSSTLSDYEFPPSYVCTGCKTTDEGFVDKLCKIFKPKSRDKSPSDKSMTGRNTYENLNADKRKSSPQRKTKSKAKKQDASSKLSTPVEQSKADTRKVQKLKKEKKTGKTKGDLEDKTSKESTGSNETGSSKKSKKRAKGSKESIQSTTSEGDKKDKKIAKGKKRSTESVTSKSSDEGKKNKKDKKGKSSKESVTTKESVPTESAKKNKKKNKKSKDSQESLVTPSVKMNEKGKKSKVVKTKTPSKGSIESISSEGGQKSPKSKKGKGSKEKLEIKVSDDKKDKKAIKTKGKESTESVQSKDSGSGKKNKKAKKSKGSEESAQSKESVSGKKNKKPKKSKGSEESVQSEESASGKKSKSAKTVNQAKKVKKGKSVTGDISKGKKTHTFKRGGMEIIVMSSTSSSCTIICEPEPNCLVKFCRMFKGSEESVPNKESSSGKKNKKTKKSKGSEESVQSKESASGKKNKKAKKSKGSEESIRSKEPESAKKNKKAKKSKGSDESLESKLSETNKKGKKKKIKDVAVVVDGKKVKRGKSKEPKGSKQSKESVALTEKGSGKKSKKGKKEVVIKAKDSGKKSDKGKKEKEAKGSKKSKESVTLKEKESSKKGKKGKDEAERKAKESKKTVDQGKKVKKGKSVTGDISKGKKSHTFKRGGMQFVVTSSTSSSCTLICEPEPNCLVKFCNLLKGK